MKVFFLSFLLLIESFNSVALAGMKNQTELGHFSCQQTYKNICGQDSDIAMARSQRIQRIQEAFIGHALKEAYQVLDPESSIPNGFDLDDINAIKKKTVRSKVTKIFLADIRRQMDSYLKENKFPSDLKEGEIKQALATSVELSRLNAEEKKLIKNIIKNTKLISLTELDSELAPSSTDILKLYKGCAKDSFVDNAFADENKKGKFVIICPGELIAAVEFSKDRKLPTKLSYLSVIMTIGHELGHHFDSRTYPEFYQGLSNQLSSFSQQLQSRKTEDYMSELSADYWGMMTLQKIMETMKVSDNERSQWLAGALEDLCGTEDDGTHPSGQFRIENIANPILCAPGSLQL